MTRILRLIEFESFDGATNMAIDEAMLEACLTGLAPPTLRFYNFVPSCVSLGYSQTLPPDQIQRIVDRGFDVVKRPTGGRAVLHHKELTYCFVGTTFGDEVQTSGFLSASVGAAYKQICEGLIVGLRGLGVPVELGSAKSTQKQPHDCFLATTSADLHYQSKKMVGSAQLRRKTGVLQHGSILLSQEQTLMSELLSGEMSNDALAHHANLFDVLDSDLSMDMLQQSLVRGFEEAFSCVFEPGRLTQEEMEMMGKLKQKTLVGAQFKTSG